MPIVRETLVYAGPGGPFEGVLARDDAAAGPRPGVLVLPNVLGQDEGDAAKADALAALGYVGFAADLFGQGKRGERGPDQGRYMNALLGDRVALRDRLAASLATLKAQPGVDRDKVAAIGFCFGGLCVLDLARSGQAIRGGVSFHGVYQRPDYPTAEPIAAKLLVCHGWDDPLGPPDAVVGLAKELTEAGADWQLHAYGGAGHAFTDVALKGQQPRPGFGYDERADRRSWAAMRDFLGELFN